MSDALMALANQNTAPKEAAIWQPLPSLKAVDNKGFVRVQDGAGQTSHFTRSSYKSIRVLPPLSAGQEADKPGADAVDASVNVPPPSRLHDDEIEAIRRLAYERGLAEGRELQMAEHAAAQATLQADSQAEQTQQTQALLEKIQASIEGLHEHPGLRYEPLKRLAMHLAEQLVLTELSIAPTGIQRLIERCLETLDVPAASQVVVDLNPDDLTLLQSRLGPEVPIAWRLQAHADLLPGSVRVTADDAVVTDLVEHRLSALAAKLLQEPQRWQAQSMFEPQRLQARGQAAAVQDAMPKATVDATPQPLAEPAMASDGEPEMAHDIEPVVQADPEPLDDHAD